MFYFLFQIETDIIMDNGWLKTDYELKLCVNFLFPNYCRI